MVQILSKILFLALFFFCNPSFASSLEGKVEIQLTGKAFIGKFYSYDEFGYEADEASLADQDLIHFFSQNSDLCNTKVIKKHAEKFLEELKNYYGDKSLSGLQLSNITITKSSTTHSKDIECTFWSEDI